MPCDKNAPQLPRLQGSKIHVASRHTSPKREACQFWCNARGICKESTVLLLTWYAPGAPCSTCPATAFLSPGPMKPCTQDTARRTRCGYSRTKNSHGANNVEAE